MTISRRDTIGLYGRLASLLGPKVSSPEARKSGIAISQDIMAFAHADHETAFCGWGRRPMASIQMKLRSGWKQSVPI